MTTTLAVAYQARMINNATICACRVIVIKEELARFSASHLQITIVIVSVDQTMSFVDNKETKSFSKSLQISSYAEKFVMSYCSLIGKR